MLVVLPFCSKDKEGMLRLLEWTAQLSANNWHHTALVVAAGDTAREDIMEVITAAKCVFGQVQGCRQNVADNRGWPMACNAIFRTAVDYIEREACTPFLWCEPDCVPLAGDWINRIEAEYQKCGKPFMGALFERPWPHINGNAVYPPNVRHLNPMALKAEQQPWDVVDAPRTLEQAHVTSLIQHVWGEGNNPPTFNGEASLSLLRPGAVLFHRCRDDSLIRALSKRMNIDLSKTRRKIVVRRTAARGDTIAASFIAQRLTQLGYQVTFQSSAVCHPWLKRIVPPLELTEINGACHINLDGAYETHPERDKRTFADLFVERTNSYVSKYGMPLLSARNYATRMKATESEQARWRNKLSAYPRPWVIICPRSRSHIRVVHDDIWKQAAPRIDGSKFWLATHGPAPAGIIDLKNTSMDDAFGIISVSDLLITPDTGPMYLSAALGIPTIAIEQSASPDLHLSDQCDWVKIRPPLPCLNCNAQRCVLNNNDPPCSYIDPDTIAEASNRRLRAQPDDVSVAMAIYRPPAERLNRCLTALLPQVKEIVVAWDQHGILPQGALKHPKIRYVQTWQRDIGYGRKANFSMRHTVGKWVLFCGDDVYVEPDTVAKLMECRKPDVAVISALLFYPSGKIQHGGTARMPGMRGWVHLDVGKTQSQFTEPVEMENVTGACVLVQRRAFYEVGGFDENLYLCCEDNDLNLRMRQAGYKIMFTPHAKAIHEESVSTRTTPNFPAIVQKSEEYLRQKWNWYFERNKDIPIGLFQRDQGDQRALLVGDRLTTAPFYPTNSHPANPMDETCRGLETKKAAVKKIAVVYIYPLDGKDEHGDLARNFVQSYHNHPPGFDHDTVIVCNGAPVTQNAKGLFSSLPNCTFLEHDDSGWDIGGYQKAAWTVPCDLMVFFGGSTLLRRAGWLKRMVEAYEKHGEGLYGVMANTGDVNGRHGRVVYPHIRTTGFWTSPALMNLYPVRVLRNNQRYEFEHGVTCLSEWVRKQGMPVVMVTWDGEYKKDWHLIENGLHRGDQSALIVWDRLNCPPYYPKR